MMICTACGSSFEDGARFCPYDGGPLRQKRGTAPADPLVGKWIAGRYELLERIGSGGFSVVYRARSQALGELAIKLLHGDLATEPPAIARFAREARAASGIDHPNVVRILDFGVDTHEDGAGGCYLAMELLRGRMLSSEVAKGHLPVARAVHVLGQVAAGLARAHQNAIVHRDVKPENVLLISRGTDADFVKLLDFGLARSFGAGAEPGVTLPGEVFGTPESMAPEQWQAAPADARTDVYALGVLGYLMLAGQPPFSGSVAKMMFHHLSTAPPPFPPSRRVPPALAGLVRQCLEKDPARRPQHAGEVLDALQPIARELPQPAVRTTYAEITTETTRVVEPTVYQSRVDPLWDGVAVAEEIARLQQLRGRRLRELAEHAWGAALPDAVGPALGEMANVERQMDALGEEVALLRAQIEEVVAKAAAEDAALRHALVEASLEAQMAQSAIPAIDAEWTVEAGPDDLPSEPTVAAAEVTRDVALSEVVRRQAEQRLADAARAAEETKLALAQGIGARLEQLRAAEAEWSRLREAIEPVVSRQAGTRPDLSQSLLELKKIDGALAAYCALLVPGRSA